MPFYAFTRLLILAAALAVAASPGPGGGVAEDVRTLSFGAESAVREAQERLAAGGPEAREALGAALPRMNAAARARSLMVLERAGDVDAAEWILPLLDDSDARVRWRANRALEALTGLSVNAAAFDFDASVPSGVRRDAAEGWRRWWGRRQAAQAREKADAGLREKDVPPAEKALEDAGAGTVRRWIAEIERRAIVPGARMEGGGSPLMEEDILLDPAAVEILKLGPAAVPELVKLLPRPLGDIRENALEGMPGAGGDETRPPEAGLRRERPTGVREPVLGTIPDLENLRRDIRGVARPDDTLPGAAAAILEAITGEKFGLDRAKWEAWMTSRPRTEKEKP
ncbi:MAG: hypothetical protein V1809_12775 [Planctomycetota bacterium]